MKKKPQHRQRVPARKEIVFIALEPVRGSEQGGRRPALVLSPASYNGLTGMMIACPITSVVKGYPFEVAVQPSSRVKGVILVDQLRSIDWRERGIDVVGSVDDATMRRMQHLFMLLIGKSAEEQGVQDVLDAQKESRLQGNIDGTPPAHAGGFYGARLRRSSRNPP
mgnify:CR=1 FL=1